MFRAGGFTTQPNWNCVEDDFVLGACAHRPFGFISRSPTGVWTAFNSNAHPVGEFDTLSDAQSALWATHQPTHTIRCIETQRSWLSLCRRGGRRGSEGVVS